MRLIQKAITLGMAATLLSGCAYFNAGPNEAQSQQAARQIVEAYDIPAMLGQAGPIVAQSLNENLPAAVDADVKTRLRAAISQAFDSAMLVENVAQNLVARAANENKRDFLLKAAQALETDVAQEMIALEDAAASEEFAQGFGEFLKKPVAEEADVRMAQVRDLAMNLRISELQIGFNLGMLQGMLRARNAAAPEDYQTSPENQQRILDSTRQGLNERLDQQIPVLMFYAYRDVSDDTLFEYANLQAQPSLQWVNKAVARSVGNTLMNAADRVPAAYRAQGEST